MKIRRRDGGGGGGNKQEMRQQEQSWGLETGAAGESERDPEMRMQATLKRDVGGRGGNGRRDGLN